MLPVILCLGCASTNKHWKSAQEKDNIAAYESFLSRHSSSPYTSQAKSRLEELRWLRCESVDSVAEYDAFLREYPSSRHAAQCKAKLSEARWQMATSANTIGSYKTYLEQHPDSHYASEANDRMAFLRDSIFRSQESIGLRVEEQYDCCRGISAHIEQLARRYLEATGKWVIINGNQDNGVMLRISVTGDALAEDYSYKGTKYHLYTGADISGKISLMGFDTEVAETFKGSLPVADRYFLGHKTLKDEVSDTKPSVYQERVTNDLNRIVETHRFPSQALYAQALDLSTFYSSLSNIIAEVYGAEPLLVLMKDTVFDVRESAIQSLLFLRKDTRAMRWGDGNDSTTIAYLTSVVTNTTENINIRTGAGRVLALYGQPVIAPMVTVLKGADWDAQKIAESTLVEIGSPAREFFLSALHDKDPTTRKVAVRGLGEIADYRDVNALIDVLYDESTDFVVDAKISALARFGSRAVDPILTSIIDRVKDGKGSGPAYAVLGHIGRPAIEPAILLLRNENVMVRRVALYTLYRIRYTIQDNLMRILGSQSKDAYDCSYAIIGAMMGRLDDENAVVREEVAGELKALFIRENEGWWRGDAVSNSIKALIDSLGEGNTEASHIAAKRLETIYKQGIGNDHKTWLTWWANRKDWANKQK